MTQERKAGPLPAGITRGLLIAEVVIVLALSLGKSGVYAVVSFLRDLTSGVSLSGQTAVLNGSLAPDRPWLDLVLQLLRISFALVPVALVWYLLVRSDDGGLRGLGVDRRSPWRDISRGSAVAAAIGGSGLLLYLLAYRVGVNLVVTPEALGDHWWKPLVLILAAIQNAILEEVVVLGYLVLRLRQLSWGTWAVLATSSLVRASYHLYQGIGGFVGNAIMGVIFGMLYLRWGRVMPLLIAHALIDIVAFLGYGLLSGRVDWLPG